LNSSAFLGLSSLVYLNLENNKINLIDPSSHLFAGLSLLNRLSIASNGFENFIVYETFKEMTKLTILSMEHNNIISIAPNSFSKMDILSDLDLSDNNLYEVNARMFYGLKSLTKLNLEFNFIQKIEDESFGELKSLMKLDLSDNNLTEIGCLYFQGLIELINLDLNYNKIRSICTNKTNSSSAFTQNELLEYIDMGNNYLESIEVGVFDGIVELKYLYLQNNFIKSLNKNAFRNLLKLESLDLSNNFILNIQQQTFFGLDNLKSLFLTNNFINEMESESFSKFGVLNQLDLSHNRITNLTGGIFKGLFKLQNFILSSNRIEKISQNIFSDLKFLTTLDLTNNQIEILEIESLKGLNSLKELYISKNSISYFDAGFQARLSYFSVNYLSLIKTSYALVHKKQEIYELDLTFQKISILESNSFDGQISILSLDNNDILSLEAESFLNLPYLLKISIKNNLLRSLRANTFKFYLLNLTHFDLSHNHLSFIEETFFEKIPILSFLDLSVNYFKSVDNFYFTYLGNLDFLNISSNSILNFEENAFKNLSKVSFIDLSRNFVSTFPLNLFKNVQNLQKLIIRENKIEDINFSKFKGLKSLKSIDLGFNSLNFLNNESFFTLSSLESLDLASNKLYKSLNDSLKNLNTLKNIDLSSNLITTLNNDEFKSMLNLKSLILSNNYLTKIDNNLSNLNGLTSLFMSNVSLGDISRLDFDSFESLEYLDLSFNRLNFLAPKLFFKKRNLIYLNVKNNNLSDFTFLNVLSNLNEIDLSGNQKIDLESIKSTVKTLRVQKSNLKSLEGYEFELFQKIEYLDASYNNIKSIPYLKISDSLLTDPIQYYFSLSIRYLDFSFNSISMINNSLFKDKPMLSYIGLEKSFTPKLKYFLYYFNDNLKSIRLIDNYLVTFPVFCSNYSLSRICLLEKLDIRSNQFGKILLKNLVNLKKLKYLNLANNSISTIDKGSFDSLSNLEYLSLASNKISNLDHIDLFKNLLNLKDLNLSLNSIEILNENLFSNLNKLVTIDLSFNRIILIKNYSFNSLGNLKNLYLNDNSDYLSFESELSFNKLKSLVNIFITKSILINIKANKCFFKTLAKLKNTKSLKNVSRNYYNSINLLALISDESTLAYDCNLTLSFIQYNIHFNFKSDLDLFFYTESDCERRFLVKAEFREFKICDNISDLIQEEEFAKNFESDILWGIFSLSSIFLFFFVIFLCTIHYNCENTRIQSILTSTFLPIINVF
jgi:Leucine-rich repeat (LRR) protein